MTRLIATFDLEKGNENLAYVDFLRNCQYHGLSITLDQRGMTVYVYA